MTSHQGTTGTFHMRRIRLEIARSKDHAPGIEGHAYELVAPLDEAGHISVEGWRAERGRCFVHKIENGRVTDRGLLVHKAGGEGGSTWAFDYPDLQGAEDEDRGYHFSSRCFVPGEYVSLLEHDGVTRTYRVTSVSPA